MMFDYEVEQLKLIKKQFNKYSFTNSIDVAIKALTLLDNIIKICKEEEFPEYVEEYITELLEANGYDVSKE